MNNLFTFIDISEKEQCEELRSYFKGLGADISEENHPDDSFHIDLQQLIGVCDITFKDPNEGDIEMALNSLVSLIILVPFEKNENYVYSFCEKLTKAPTSKLALVCLRVLQNLFEGLPEMSQMHYEVYYSLVKLAGQTDSIQLVYSDTSKLKSWLHQKQLSPEKVQRLLRLLHETLLSSKQGEQASKVMIELLGTYTEDNASQARDDAHRCIVACLADPNTFLMDHLLTLKPVRFLEGELIHDLLTIFVSEKLSVYMQFYNVNKDFVLSLGLNHDQNIQKMRLLTFMQLAENKKEVPFDLMQKELLLSAEEVEEFIIDALRTKMIRAKIDQGQKRVLVSCTMHRTFGKPQWQQLREILTRWRSGLQHVETSMASVISTQFEQMTSVQS